MTRLIECPVDKAEGRCNGVPYNTELVSIDGVTVHFWMGDDPSRDKAVALQKRMARERDVVGCTYSSGEPTGFWAHSDVKDADHV